MTHKIVDRNDCKNVKPLYVNTAVRVSVNVEPNRVWKHHVRISCDVPIACAAEAQKEEIQKAAKEMQAFVDDMKRFFVIKDYTIQQEMTDYDYCRAVWLKMDVGDWLPDEPIKP